MEVNVPSNGHLLRPRTHSVNITPPYCWGGVIQVSGRCNGWVCPEAAMLNYVFSKNIHSSLLTSSCLHEALPTCKFGRMWANLPELTRLFSSVVFCVWGATEHILAKNMVLASPFQVKLDGRVFRTPGWHHSSSMETCVFYIGVLGHNRLRLVELFPSVKLKNLKSVNQDCVFTDSF